MDIPKVEMWRHVPSPRAYEKASRERMAASGDPSWMERAKDPKPVEGETEVDLVLEGASFLLFVEAKLHSDLSMRTTYDPTRNQLARNIDVLLEQTRGRRAIMWMLVPHRHADREYIRLTAAYRREPGLLHALLPHRKPEDLDRVIADLRVMRWADLSFLIGKNGPADVLAELERRVSMP